MGVSDSCKEAFVTAEEMQQIGVFWQTFEDNPMTVLEM